MLKQWHAFRLHLKGLWFLTGHLIHSIAPVSLLMSFLSGTHELLVLPSPCLCPILAPRALSRILDTLRRHPSLAAITLERCQVDDAAARLIRRLLEGDAGGKAARGAGAAMQAAQHDTHISLQHGPAQGAAQPACRASSRPASAPSIKVLRVVRCSMSESAASIVAAALSSSVGLRTFVFSGNTIEPSSGRAAVANAFAQALRTGANGLRQLTLGFSRGCPLTAEVLAGVVADGEAPASLRHVVVHRRETSPRGLQAWAGALAGAGGASGEQEQLALTLRAHCPLTPRTAAARRANNSGTSISSSDGGGGGSGRPEGGRDEGEAVESRETLGRAGGRLVSHGSNQRFLYVEQLPITFVMDADHDALLQDSWLTMLPTPPAQRLSILHQHQQQHHLQQRQRHEHEQQQQGAAPELRSQEEVQNVGPGCEDVTPVRDQDSSNTDSSAASPSRCLDSACSSKTTAHTSLCIVASNSAADGQCSDLQKLTASANMAEGSGSGREAVGQGYGMRGGCPHLVVLSPSDAGDAVVSALKGLPLKALDLGGLDLGPRVSLRGEAMMGCKGCERAVRVGFRAGDQAMVRMYCLGLYYGRRVNWSANMLQTVAATGSSQHSTR